MPGVSIEYQEHRDPVRTVRGRVTAGQQEAVVRQVAERVNIFWPLITHSSPSRAAFVLQANTSDPPSGSVYPRQISVSPAATPGRTWRLSSGDPGRGRRWPTAWSCPVRSSGRQPGGSCPR